MKKKSSVFEKEKTKERTINVPGFKKEEINVFVENGVIKISAHKKSHTVDKGKNFYSEEAFHKSITRTLTLPKGLEKNNIDVKISDGSVTVKKLEK